jgi:hypothetical protein
MTTEEIQSKCQQTYLNNMAYFKDKHPKVFEKMMLFGVAIEQGMYKEKYSLEFINNSFDVKVLADDVFIYNQNLDTDAANRVQSITMDYKKSFKTFEYALIPKKYTMTALSKALLFPLVKYSQKYSSKKNEILEINKFIFFGVLLGRQVDLFVKTHTPRAILILEQDIEIFRLSMFVTDYSKIANSTKIHIFITSDTREFKQLIPKFIREFAFYNYILKFDVINETYYKYMDVFLNTLTMERPEDWHFGADLLSLARTVSVVKQGYKYIDFRQSFDIFSNHSPVILVAPGPSLLTNIEWLKQNAHRFIVVSIGAAVKSLYKRNIKVDIVTTVDPTIHIRDQFTDIEKEYFDETLFIASSNTDPEVLDIFPKSNTYIYQGAFDMFELDTFIGMTVAEISLSMLLRLGVKRLYLFGTDLSLDKDSGATHVQEYKTDKQDISKEYNMLDVKSIKKSDIFKVRGNFQKTVVTTRMFKEIISLYSMYISRYIDHDVQKVFNLSDGAFIDGTISMHCENVKIQAKLNKKQILSKSKMDTYIASQEQLKSPQWSIDIDITDEILKILNKYKKNRYRKYDDMMNGKFTVDQKVHKLFRTHLSSRLFANLHMNSAPYINKFFDNRENRINKERFNAMFQLWIKANIVLFKEYKKKLEELREYLK